MSNNNTCKIVLVGDAGTGKTCIIARFVNNKFEKSQMTTACPSFCTKSISFTEDNKSLNLDIWDTAGQEIYRAISKLFYKGASIGILVYDITSQKSFDSIKNYWYKELKENTDENIIFAVVGNKVDLYEQEEVGEEEAKEFANSINAEFFLTSAKNNVRVSDLFINTGKKFMGSDSSYTETKKEDNAVNDDKNKERINLQKKEANNDNKGACC